MADVKDALAETKFGALSRIRHLDLTYALNFSPYKLVKFGAYGDVIRYRYITKIEDMDVAAKRLRKVLDPQNFEIVRIILQKLRNKY